MQTRNTDRLCLLLPRVVCLLSRFALPALALVAGVTTDVNATSMGDARVVQGRFASEADQTSFQATLSQVFGDEVKIANPGDSLVDGDGAAGDHFGISVALADDTAVVGAYADHTTAGNGAGSAYVLTRVGATWTIQAKLTAVGGQAFDNFGYSVALSGDTALVGAHRDSTVFGHTSGSAYVFTRVGTSWSQQAHLFAVDGATGNFFGYSVALLGDTALIGARLGDSPSSFDAGSAYVFTRSGVDWSQQAKLIASDGVANDNFGVSVALTNDTALVGADLADNLGGEDSGSAYVFTRTGDSWSEQMRLTAGDGAMTDRFGNAVALSGDTALVGANMDDTPAGENSGSAYVFTRGGTSWTAQAHLIAADGAMNDQFGLSVALSADTALVGAGFDDTAAGEDAGSAYVFFRSGANWSEQEQLTADDGAALDGFGNSVALWGDTAFVGASADDTLAGSDAGSVHNFIRSDADWNEQARLTSGIGAAFSNFGRSVAISGDTALVGANADDTAAGTNAGSAYVFARTGGAWNLQAKLTASDGAANDRFGFSVALSGDTALVGAVTDQDPAGAEVGSVYVFTRSGSGWSQQAKLIADDGAASDFFGISISLSADTALIGAHGNDTPAGLQTGAAYVFTRSGASWSQQEKLAAADGAENDYFGFSVALSDDTALIGALGNDTSTVVDAGSAYVFTRSGINWTQQANLTAGDAMASDLMGYAVALAADTALLGAHGNDTAAGTQAGSAYVFFRSGSSWTEQAQLTADDGASFDRFGISVAMSGDTAMVGANADAIAGIGTFAGSAYRFTRSGNSWSQQTKLIASDASANDAFGSAVAISGETVLVGAPNDGGPATGNPFVGSIYIYGPPAIGIFVHGFETSALLPPAPKTNGH